MTTTPPIPITAEDQHTYDSIVSIWIDTSCSWLVYQDLFHGGSEEIELLNRVAPNLFALIQRTSIQNIVLGLCRLTDPCSQGAYENMSLGQLVRLIPSGTSAQPGPSGEDTIADVRTHLEDLVRIAVDAAAPLRALRNKRIAHLDAQEWRVQRSWSIKPEEIEGTLEAVWRTIDHFAYFWDGARWHDKPIANKDARGLTRHLRMAEDYKRLYQEGYVPAPRYLRTLSGNQNDPTALQIEKLEKLGVELPKPGLQEE